MECQISGRPFTVFRWRPGQDARCVAYESQLGYQHLHSSGSYKKTVICREVALAKNVCQCCILDLETGLPVQVRDAALGLGEQLPASEVGREYALHQMQQAMANGTFKAEAGTAAAAGNELLRRLARTAPYYKRNRAKICTFWLRNACTRTDCPFRPCNGDSDMPELTSDPALRSQNIRDRYAGVNDPVAEKLLRRAEEGGGSAGGTRAAGVPDAGGAPPDLSITTLFVGGCDERVDEPALRDHFHGFGEVASVRLVAQRRAAFVTFVERAAADAAVAALSGGKLIVKGLRLRVMWGKPAARGEPGAGAGAATHVPPPSMPPGWQLSGAYPSMDARAMGSPATHE